MGNISGAKSGGPLGRLHRSLRGWRSGTRRGVHGAPPLPPRPTAPAPRAEPPQRQSSAHTASPQPPPGPAGGRGLSPGAGPGWGCADGADPSRDRRSAPPLPAPPRSGGARARGDNFPRSFCRRAAAAVPCLAAGLRARATGRNGGRCAGEGKAAGAGGSNASISFSCPFPRSPSPQEQPGAAASIMLRAARLRQTDRPSHTAAPCGGSALPTLAGSGGGRSRLRAVTRSASARRGGRDEGVGKDTEGKEVTGARRPLYLYLRPRSRGVFPPGAAPRTAAARERQGVQVFRGWPARSPPVPALPPYPQTTPSPPAPAQPLI